MSVHNNNFGKKQLNKRLDLMINTNNQVVDFINTALLNNENYHFEENVREGFDLTLEHLHNMTILFKRLQK